MRTPLLPIGTKVRFKESVLESMYYAEYRGHEFVVYGYMPDDGLEIDLDTGEIIETYSAEILTDHVMLHCYTDRSIMVRGCVHDSDLEIIE